MVNNLSFRCWILSVCFCYCHVAKGDHAELIFRATCQVSSPPCGENPDKLRDFLQTPNIRNLFLSAGGSRKCEELESQNFRKFWNEACDQYYVTANKDSIDNIFVVATETSVKFPGFQTINIVVNACPRRHQRSPQLSQERLFSRQNDSNQKEEHVVHEFYLIADQKRFEGPKPVVWLVRKLAGPEQTEYQLSSTRAWTKVSIVRQKNKQVIFQLDVDVAVHVEFPKLLLKLLPAPQSKVEERGARAVGKAITKDITVAVKAVQVAWETYQQEETKAAQKPISIHQRRRQEAGEENAISSKE